MWYRKASTKLTSPSSSSADRLTMRIAGKLIRYQWAIAAKLTTLTARLSSRSLKILWLLFVTAWLLLGVYFIRCGFAKEWSLSSSMPHKRLFPRTAFNPGPTVSMEITESEYRKLENARLYIDSLKMNTVKLYDSLVQQRPGLIDSLNKALEIYHQQKK